MPVKFLRLREAVKRHCRSLCTVRRWAAEGRIPVGKIGWAVAVDEREIEKLIEARAVPVRPDLAV